MGKCSSLEADFESGRDVHSHNLSLAVNTGWPSNVLLIK